MYTYVVDILRTNRAMPFSSKCLRNPPAASMFSARNSNSSSDNTSLSDSSTWGIGIIFLSYACSLPLPLELDLVDDLPVASLGFFAEPYNL